MIAEMQISLITHWLTGEYPLAAESVARLLIDNTRAMLSNVTSPDGRAFRPKATAL
jgi:hypothetical protein